MNVHQFRGQNDQEIAKFVMQKGKEDVTRKKVTKKTAQGGPREPPRRPKKAQVGLRRGPLGAKMAQRGALGAPRGAQRAPAQRPGEAQSGPRSAKRRPSGDRAAPGEAHSEPEKKGVQSKHVCKRWIIYLADAHRVCSRREKGWHEIGRAVQRVRRSEDN